MLVLVPRPATPTVPTCTVGGATLHMQIHALPGPILTQGIMVQEAERRFKTLNVAQWELPDAVPTPTSIRETRWEAVAPPLTIPTLESLPPVARDTRATLTPGRESPAEVVLPTIRIRVEVLP